MLEAIKKLCRDNEYFSQAGDEMFLYGKMLDMILSTTWSYKTEIKAITAWNNRFDEGE